MAGGGGMGKLVGVGFLVGAKDDGASDTFEDVSEGADRLADSAERAGSEGGRNVGLLGRALEGLMSINVSSIADSLAGLAERAGAGGVGMQATALESFSAQFNQTARAAEARLGSMSGAMRAHRGEVGSLAHTYGISGDEMFAAMAPLSRIGVDIEDTGINLRALAGHLQAGMISGQAFGGVLSELIGTYDMEADAAGGLINSLTAIGDRFGFVAEIGNGLPAIMDAIRPVAARYPNIAADVDGVATSIGRLAAGMVNMGMAPEAALSAATATFSNLGEQRNALEGMVTGLGTEFPDLAQQIGISTGDIEGSIAAVMSSPVEFAQRMGEAMRQAGEDSVFGRRLAASLSEIGPEFLNVVRDAARGGEALAQATEPIEGVEDAFNRAGQSALTSTLTFDQQLERMRDSFTTRMNSIGRRTMPDFMSRQRDAYRNVGETIERFAADDGPLGSLTRGFLRVRTFGLVQGLIPQLGILGQGFGEAAESAGPLLRVGSDLGIFQRLGPMLGRFAGVLRIVGTRFLTIFGPIGLVVGAGLLLYRYWDRIPDLFNSIQQRLEGAGQWFQRIGTRFSDWVKTLDWQKMGREAMDGLFNAITGTIRVLFSGGEVGGGEAGDAFAAGFHNIVSGLGRMLGGLFSGVWGRLTDGFQTELGGAAGVVQRVFGLYFNTIQTHFRNLWAILSTVGRVLIAPWRAWWQVIQPIASMVLGLFSDGGDEADGFTNIMDGVVGTMERWQTTIIEGVSRFEEMGASFATFWENTVQDAVQPVLDALREDLPFIQKEFTKIWEDASELIPSVFTAIGEVAGVLWDLWTDTMEPIFDIFSRTISRLFGGGRDSIDGKAEYSFREVGTGARNMWTQHIRPTLANMITAFARAFNWIVENGSEVFTELAIRGGSAMIRIQSGIERVRAAWEGMQTIMRTGWQAVQTHTEGIIGNMIDFVDLTFQRMVHGWQRIIMNLKVFLVTSVQSVIDNIRRVLEAVPPRARSLVPGADALLAGVTRASERIDATVDSFRDRQREMNREQQQEEGQLLRNIRMRREEMERTSFSARQAVTDTVEAQRRIGREQQQQLGELGRFYTNMGNEIREGSREAYREMLDIGGRLARGEITANRQADQRVARIERAAALGERLGELPEGVRRRLGAAGMRQLEEAIGRRGMGEQRALSTDDVQNVISRLEGIRGGRAARGDAVNQLASMIESGRLIGPPSERQERRGRGARRGARRAVEGRRAETPQAGASGPDGSRANPVHMVLDQDNTSGGAAIPTQESVRAL